MSQRWLARLRGSTRGDREQLQLQLDQAAAQQSQSSGTQTSASETSLLRRNSSEDIEGADEAAAEEISDNAALAQKITQGFVCVKTDMNKNAPASAGAGGAAPGLRNWKACYATITGTKLVFYKAPDDVRAFFTEQEKAQAQTLSLKRPGNADFLRSPLNASSSSLLMSPSPLTVSLGLSTTSEHGVHLTPTVMDEETVRMLFNTDMMSRYEYGEEVVELDPTSGAEMATNLLLLIDGKLYVLKRRNRLANSKYKFVCSSSLGFVATALRGNDSATFVDCMELRIVHDLHVYRFSTSASRQRWLGKLEDCKRGLAENQSTSPRALEDRHKLICEHEDPEMHRYEFGAGDHEPVSQPYTPLNDTPGTPTFDNVMDNSGFGVVKKHVKGGTSQALLTELLYEESCEDYIDEFAATSWTFLSLTEMVEGLGDLLKTFSSYANNETTEETIIEETKLYKRFLDITLAWKAFFVDCSIPQRITLVFGSFGSTANSKGVTEATLDIWTDLFTSSEPLAAKLGLTEHHQSALKEIQEACALKAADPVSESPSPRKLSNEFHIPDIAQFLQLDPADLAAQLTLYDHELWSAISNFELVEFAFDKPEGTKARASLRKSLSVNMLTSDFSGGIAEGEAPRLPMALQESIPSKYERLLTVRSVSARITAWTAALVVSCKDLYQRAQLIGHLIHIAWECKRLNSFNVMGSIVRGLHLHPVYRLNKTWEEVATDAHDLYGQCSAIALGDDTFAKYRSLLRKIDPSVPAIPDSAIVFKDLENLQKTNPAISADIVNFRKNQVVSRLCGWINRFQAVKFAGIQPDESLLGEIKQWGGVPQEQATLLSFKAEPRSMTSSFLLTTSTLDELVNSSDQGGSLAQGSAVANVRERVATLKEASRHSDGQSASVFSKLLGMADSDKGLMMSPSKKGETAQVLGGSLDRLVSRLFGDEGLDPSLLDSEFLACFLFTLPTFSGPLEFMDAIKSKFKQHLSLISNASAMSDDSYLKQVTEIMSLRFMKIGTTWINNHLQDFQENEDVANHFIFMLDSLYTDQHADKVGTQSAWTEQLKKTLTNKLRQRPSMAPTVPAFKMTHPITMRTELLAEDVDAIAETISATGVTITKALDGRDYIVLDMLIETELVRVLTPLNKDVRVLSFEDMIVDDVFARLEETMAQLTPDSALPGSIENIFSYYFRIRDFGLACIADSEPTDLKTTFVSLISLAKKFIQLQNHFAARAVLAALLDVKSRSHMSEWKAVPKPQLAELEAIYSTINKARLHSRPVNDDSEASFLPHFGHLLEDMIHTAKDADLTSGNLINFEKRRKLYDLIQAHMVALKRMPAPQQTANSSPRADEFQSLVFARRPASEVQSQQAVAKHSAAYFSGRIAFFTKLANVEREKQQKAIKELERVELELRERKARTDQLKQSADKSKKQLTKGRKELSRKADMDRLKDLLKARAQNPSVFITNQKPVLVITLAGAMNIGPAYNYTKRTNVLRITPEVGPQYLVQALDRPEMLMWINSLTLAAEAATNAKRRSGAMVEDSEETIDPQLLELPKELSSGNLVFGTSLEELARRDNATVPLIIEKCIAEVERRGLTEEGIYRVSPSAIHMQELRVAIDKGGVNSVNFMDVGDINIVTGLLKLLLRILPDPVIPFSYYDAFIEAMAPENSTDKLWRLKEILFQLPAVNFYTLKRLAEHWETVTHYEESNHMYAYNLALIFGPSVVRARALNSMMNMGKHNQIIRHLVDQYHWLFDVDQDAYTSSLLGAASDSPLTELSSSSPSESVVTTALPTPDVVNSSDPEVEL